MTLLEALRVPAPPEFRVVYDNPQNAGGVDPATGQPYPAVGQYADVNTNTVHTTRGFSRRQIAQDVGQLFGYNVLAPGDRMFFSKLLGTDPGAWENRHGSEAMGGGGATGDEAFSDYYALAATGGLKPGQSMSWGDVSIDPAVLRKFSGAIVRLGRRRGLPALNLTEALSGR